MITHTGEREIQVQLNLLGQSVLTIHSRQRFKTPKGQSKNINANAKQPKSWHRSVRTLNKDSGTNNELTRYI